MSAPAVMPDASADLDHEIGRPRRARSSCVERRVAHSTRWLRRRTVLPSRMENHAHVAVQVNAWRAGSAALCADREVWKMMSPSRSGVLRRAATARNIVRREQRQRRLHAALRRVHRRAYYAFRPPSIMPRAAAMHFLLFYTYVPDVLERRPQFRGAHLKHARAVRRAWRAHAGWRLRRPGGRGRAVLLGALESRRRTVREGRSRT